MNEEQRKEIEKRFDRLDDEPCCEDYSTKHCNDCICGCAKYIIRQFIIAEVERAEKEAVLKYDREVIETTSAIYTNHDGNTFKEDHYVVNKEKREQALKNLGGEK